ncbi:DNA-binding response regulator [Chitinophaga silvatica]|uniref:DNA-binding response regulator n=1 Tax=Chitinophaga silvatica TaxID=2282649 RepID=A0A3E1Y628_9BACT|nr:response regulator transcription factor [Chitinophaga silvatica]RFS20175.1 DNA-binding response regulator [Chitinophaga silvatica]
MNCRVLIADDHVLFNDAIKAMLEAVEGITVVGQVSRGNEVIPMIDKTKPDICLLDINMPGQNGLMVAERLKESGSATRVIIISMYQDKRFVTESKRIKADGYLLKDASKAELLAAIEMVMNGETFYDPKLGKDINQHAEDSFIKKFNLTKREIEIIRLVKENMTAREIADKLCLSVLTIETHRRNINLKLGIKNTLSLVRFAETYNI